MTALLERLVSTTRLDQDEILDRTAQIYRTLLARSQWMESGNFRTIHPADLELLFDQYDRLFFDEGCRRVLGPCKLTFRLSKRMTRAAGKTFRYTPRQPGRLPYYEIAVSTTLLFQAFREGDRPVTVTGLPCRDRLQALQRLFEHEMLHLVEMLVWEHSSCSAARFQTIAANLFGHTEHTHALITHQERAYVERGVRPGSRVRFRFEGAEYVGVVNRITKRATVLVEDPRGQKYSDGKRYAKFYIPLNMLEPVAMAR
ncbi:hypothetical protein Mal4_11970 [Maioricimonas rarisocia]|uniref:SprT-like family protein n=1 Tax=Maioricimonas rarisocia TaxID=2528026 RepID=A0A517Z379_9PLAN|nr:hypothetical protein [Maioricimonas rarisocia]QDU36896.1 hypothetical protein Mal4_11970 [Maioricimonas rarisocia]